VSGDLEMAKHLRRILNFEDGADFT